MKILGEVWIGQTSVGANQQELTTSAQIRRFEKSPLRVSPPIF
jgi:hypothetical protein